MKEIKREGELCPVCNRIADKLIAMEDNGKGQKCCVKCKRAIKKGKKIEKFTGEHGVYNE